MKSPAMTQSSTSRSVWTRLSGSAPDRFALENSNGIGGKGDFSSSGIGRTEEEEEFSFLVCVCCFLPPQICARSKSARSKIVEGEGEGEGEGKIMNLHREEEEEEEEEEEGGGKMMDLHPEEEDEHEEKGDGKMMNLNRCRPWFDLPADILDIIVSHLQFADYARFGAVCKSWRSITADTPHLRALQHPWFAIVDKSATLFSPVEDRFYHLNVPFASNSRCIGRTQGCLIFIDESEGGHIFNPFTNQTIKFPYSRDLKVPRGFERACLSSAPAPLRAGAPRDCVLTIFFDFGILGFCRPGDQDLFLHDRCPHTLLDVVFFKGLLYCLTLHFNLMVLEFGPGMKYTESYIALDPVKLLNVRHDDSWDYLVEFAGELLMVLKYWEFAEEDWDAYRTVAFGFYKLDFSGVPKWVEVETIGDKMLLLADNNYLRCFDALDFSASGFRPNCIYFTDGELDKYQWRMFSLEDKKIHPFSPTTSWAIRSPLNLIKPSNA